MAAGSQHVPRPREVDLWRRARHLRREPESRLSARRRRTAEDRPSTDTAVSRDRPERAIPACRIAVAQREHGVAARCGRIGSGPGERDGDLARGVAAVPRARRRLALGALARGRQRRGTDRRGVDAVGQAVQASARGLHQPLRRGEARVGGRRPHARDLQVHQRRQAARADDRHAERSGRRRHALQPPDVHGVAARRELLRVGWVQRHARREVRRRRQVPVRLRHARRVREGDASRAT